MSTKIMYRHVFYTRK